VGSCGQRDVGAVEGEMALPGREEEQTTANGPPAALRAGATGRGKGRGSPQGRGRGSAWQHVQSTRPEASRPRRIMATQTRGSTEIADSTLICLFQ
jgi:hypothetical protein